MFFNCFFGSNFQLKHISLLLCCLPSASCRSTSSSSGSTFSIPKRNTITTPSGTPSRYTKRCNPRMNQMAIDVSVLQIVGFCLAYTNSSINPIALYFISSSFRQHFNRLLCCFCGSRTSRRRSSLWTCWSTSLTTVNQLDPMEEAMEDPVLRARNSIQTGSGQRQLAIESSLKGIRNQTLVSNKLCVTTTV